MVAVNAAVVAFVDELLRMPSAAAAATAVDLLYGAERQAPPALLAHVNGGVHIPLASLLTSPSPLASLLLERFRISSAWRTAGQELRGARSAARARYRDLQAAFVAWPVRPVPEPAASVVRYTYGAGGRQWQWEEAAARLLHRVSVLNRAVLDLLAATARGLATPAGWLADAATARDFDLPAPTLDLMAATLPPLAVPDWARLVPALAGSSAAPGEESLVRYRALLAEILDLRDRAEARA